MAALRTAGRLSHVAQAVAIRPAQAQPALRRLAAGNGFHTACQPPRTTRVLLGGSPLARVESQTVLRGSLLQCSRNFSSLPEHIVLSMPALSPTMTQGNIATYKVKVGDKVAPGDLICDIETDKATIGWESQDEGYVAAIAVPEGSQDVPVGKPVLVLVEEQGSLGAFSDYKPSDAPAAAPSSSSPAPAAAAAPAAPAAPATNYPAHNLLSMPALSPTMTAGNIATYKVKVGEKIAPGDLICDIETDKATIGWESQEEGFVAAIIVPEGSSEVPVGSPVLVVVDDKTDVPAFASYQPPSSSPAAAAPTPPAAPASTSAAAPPSAPPPSSSAAPARAAGERVLASPLARALARAAGVDLAGAGATGPHGRVIAADVQALIASGKGAAPAAAAPAGVAGTDYSEVPHTQIRKVIASRLVESKTTVPHYYLTMDVSVKELMALRGALNAQAKKDKDGVPAYKLSVNDFIIKACALALREHPDVNSSWMDTVIRRYNYIDVSVAVASPTGLITPIVQDADMKGLVAISNEVKELAGKAQEGRLQPHEFQGGTFSVSNLGMFGVSSFSAIINPPQSCILAVGAAEDRVVPQGSGFGVESFVKVTLSCDHRTVDGAVGAGFLQTLKSLLQNPSSMLL